MTNYNDYPVKYAVLELREKGGWAVGYEYVTQGFIAEKCFVVGSELRYVPGNSILSHRVVFPYEDIELFKSTNSMGERQLPHYDINGQMAYERTVSKLYDTYEEAKEASQKANEEYKGSLISKIDYYTDGWKEELENLKEIFNKRLQICYSFEEEALELTKDLKVKDSNSKVLKKEEL